MVQHQYNVPRLTKTAVDAKKKTLAALNPQRREGKNLEVNIGSKSRTLNLTTSVFLDETGVMLKLTRTYARSPRGMRSVGFETLLSRRKGNGDWCN